MTVTLSANSSYLEVYLTEYSGINTTIPSTPRRAPRAALARSRAAMPRPRWLVTLFTVSASATGPARRVLASRLARPSTAISLRRDGGQRGQLCRYRVGELRLDDADGGAEISFGLRGPARPLSGGQPFIHQPFLWEPIRGHKQHGSDGYPEQHRQCSLEHHQHSHHGHKSQRLRANQ